MCSTRIPQVGQSTRRGAYTRNTLMPHSGTNSKRRVEIGLAESAPIVPRPRVTACRTDRPTIGALGNLHLQLGSLGVARPAHLRIHIGLAESATT